MADMLEIGTSAGEVNVTRRRGGWWEVRRGAQRAQSTSLMRALRFAGLQDRGDRRLVGAAIRDRRDR